MVRLCRRVLKYCLSSHPFSPFTWTKTSAKLCTLQLLDLKTNSQFRLLLLFQTVWWWVSVFTRPTTNMPVGKTNIPVPVVHVGGVRPLLHDPPRIPLTPLSHPWYFKMVFRVIKEQISGEPPNARDISRNCHYSPGNHTLRMLQERQLTGRPVADDSFKCVCNSQVSSR